MAEDVLVPKELAFSEAEYARRLRLTREHMERVGLRCLLLFDPANTYYLAGQQSVNLWDYQCLVVPVDSDPFLVLWEFELGRFLASSWLNRACSYRTHEDPVAFTARALQEQGLLKDGIGIELRSRYLPVRVYEQLREALPGIALKDGSGIVEAVRVVKSDEEIQVLRESASITSRAMSAALERVCEGALDQEIAAEAIRTLVSNGSEPACIDPIVAVGSRAGLAHSTYNGTRLGRGDPAFIELGACVHRYTAPLMRTAIVGTPSQHLQGLAGTSVGAIDAMVNAIRPGIRACDVARKGHEAISAIESEVVFHYVFGYSVGAGFPPSWLEESNFYLRADNTQELRPGMVFHLPMTLRVFGRYGVGFSETVLVSENGCEVLTQVERRLVIR